MLIITLVILFIVVAYAIVTFTNIPICITLRSLWIETAMTTADHQWLATSLFPKSVIDEVMSLKVEDNGEVGITEIKDTQADNKSNTNVIIKNTDNVGNEAEELNDIDNIDEPSEVNQSKNNIIQFSDDDDFGNEVILNDKNQGIKIVKISTASYTGYLAFIDDPSRIFVENTEYKGVKGEVICDFLDKYNAILGVNANGFMDPEGHGMGGDIIGSSISHGELWSTDEFIKYTTIGFDDQNRLVVGKLDNYTDYNLRDAVQFKPIIILNGEIYTEGSAGWGIQPRTIIAQREDGVVMFLVVDGRKPGYSIGITIGEAAEILLKYGAVTAAACDGGSSSVMAYDNAIVNIPSTPMTTGRYLPNALLVSKRTDTDN